MAQQSQARRSQAQRSLAQQLFNHDDWANRKLISACEGLTDSQLDQPKDMGFGSLRNTFFHILEAEKLWLERWQGKPWRALQTDACGQSVLEIQSEFEQIADQRNELIGKEYESNFERIVEFQDTGRNNWKIPIFDLLIHVANHGIHHRAQVLNFMRGFERKVPAGVDFIFWKLAYPSCPQPNESVEPLRQFGLEIETESGCSLEFDPVRFKKYFAYNSWANHQVFTTAGSLSEDQLDQPFEMGHGTFRKTVQHMIDAECWWFDIWTKPAPVPFPKNEAVRSLPEMIKDFDELCGKRSNFVDNLSVDDAQKIVSIYAGGPETRFRVAESMIQLCAHATHHRAQCLNMLRHLGTNPPDIDYVLFAR